MDSKMIDFALWQIGEANPLLSLHQLEEFLFGVIFVFNCLFKEARLHFTGHNWFWLGF